MLIKNNYNKLVLLKNNLYNVIVIFFVIAFVVKSNFLISLSGKMMSLENEKKEKKPLDDYIVVNKKLYILKSKKSKKIFSLLRV